MWYVQKKGKAEGPLTEEVLKKAIQRGDIGPFDLVYKDGESKWRPVAEVSAFHGDLQKETQVRPSAEVLWVLLLRQKKAKNFKTIGPLKTHEVKAKLKSGEVSWSDFAWTDGMKEWYRLTALEVFHQVTEQDVEVHHAPAASYSSDENLPPEVEILKRETVRFEEVPPPEAVIEDLIKKEEGSVAKSNLRGPSPVSAAIKKNQVVSRRLSFWNRIEEMSPSQRFWLKWGLAGFTSAIAVLVLYISTFLDFKAFQVQRSSQQDSVQKPEVQLAPTAPPVEEKILKPVETVAKPPEPQAPPAARPLVEPTYLKLKWVNKNQKNVTLEVETDASSQLKTFFEVTAKRATAIGFKSFYRRVQGPTLDFEKLKWPAGVYDIQVGFESSKYSSLKQQTTFSYLTQTPDYKEESYRHRKMLSHQAAQERFQLIQLTLKMEALLDEMIAMARKSSSALPASSYRQWMRQMANLNSQALKSIGPKSRNEYVFASEWLELKELKKQILKEATLVVQSKSPQQQINPLRESQKALRQLKESLLAASLWKT